MMGHCKRQNIQWRKRMWRMLSSALNGMEFISFKLVFLWRVMASSTFLSLDSSNYYDMNSLISISFNGLNQIIIIRIPIIFSSLLSFLVESFILLYYNILSNIIEPYQIRCTDSTICTKFGVKVVVMDFTEDNRTDLLLHSPTFKSLARPNKTDQLLDMGVGLDVEYKRWKPN